MTRCDRSNGGYTNLTTAAISCVVQRQKCRLAASRRLAQSWENFRRKALILLKGISIGLRFGEYYGEPHHCTGCFDRLRHASNLGRSEGYPSSRCRCAERRNQTLLKMGQQDFPVFRQRSSAPILSSRRAATNPIASSIVLAERDRSGMRRARTIGAAVSWVNNRSGRVEKPLLSCPAPPLDRTALQAAQCRSTRSSKEPRNTSESNRRNLPLILLVNRSRTILATA
jgi:hypothetical protein